MRDFGKRGAVTGKIIGAAMKVHTRLGPGLLESVYEACLAYELRARALQVLVQLPMPVVYEEVRLEVGYRIDMLVEDHVVVEIKAIERLHAVHKAQLLSYLRLSGKPLGLLINFGEQHLVDGIVRLANGA